jgi:hypothetical protein
VRWITRLGTHFVLIDVGENIGMAQTKSGLLGAVAALGLASSAWATANFSFRALETNGLRDMQVRDIANGYVVGWGLVPITSTISQLRAHAWSVQTTSRVDISNGLTSDAMGVDNLNQIAGEANYPDTVTGRDEATYWSSPQANPQRVLNVNPMRGTASAVQGNLVVGWGGTTAVPQPAGSFGALWDLSTQAEYRLPPPVGTVGATSGHNLDGNWVVGNAYGASSAGNPGAAAWNVSDPANPVSKNLHPPGFNYSSTNAIRGEKAVGLARQGPAGADFNHAYLWNVETGEATDLHARLPASLGAIASAASDVIGPLVIGSVLRSGGELAPVMWNLDTGEVHDLREFLPSGVTYADGVAINDNGQIAGNFRYGDGTEGGFILTPEVLPGDATFDGIVNISDFAILANRFNRTNTDWGSADFNADGQTTIADFAAMAGNFGQSSGSTLFRTAAVPEPTTLIAAPLALTLLRRRRGAALLRP